MRAYAVIGAQYGDEGKGVTVDWLVNKINELIVVVRSSGGSQASHTVVTPSGQRHAFSHFGSGTFAGAATHLSKYMICNPIMFLQELKKLQKLGLSPKVSVDPLAMVSIPLDSLINQGAETLRASGKHGSCGLGIGETVERHEHPMGFPVTVEKLSSLTVKKLRNIREEWLENRIASLGFSELPSPYDSLVQDNDISSQFIKDCSEFLNNIEIVSDHDICSLGTVVFEGAQGLALDQHMGAFPFVRRSITGLLIIIQIAEQAGISTIETHYITRCYTTRHGAGPLSSERSISNEVEVCDPTNIPNEWQDSLRFAPLDINFLRKNISDDLDFSSNVKVVPKLVVTCLDQIKETVTLVSGSHDCLVGAESVSTILEEELGYPVFESWGPTRETFKQLTIHRTPH